MEEESPFTIIEPPLPHPPLQEHKHFIKSATWAYLIMTVIGLSLMYFANDNLKTAFQTQLDQGQLITLVKCFFLAVGLAYVLDYVFAEFFLDYRSLKNLMTEILGRSSYFGAFYLAILSGFGEEILFRGGLQPIIGLFATSLLFGIVHLGPGGKITTWSAAAGLVGLILGFIFQQTTNLWPAIAAHFFINFVSILKLRSLYNSKKIETTS